MSTIIAKNIPSSVTVEKVQEFFSFCGEVKSINLINDDAKKTYQITFKQDKALSTALLLNSAELDGGKISVEEFTPSDDTLPSYDASQAPPVADNKIQSSIHTGDANYDDIEQEEKPKYAIMAQLLSHGYKVSDDLVEKAIKVDKQNGYSVKFKSFVKQLDEKYIHLDNPESTSNQLLNNFKSIGTSLRHNKYLEKVAQHPYGVKVHEFYKTLANDVIEVHNEARRLAGLRKEEDLQKKAGASESSTEAPLLSEKQNAADDLKF